jgi:hypothetical protein
MSAGERITVELRDGAHCGVIQSLREGFWKTVHIITATRSACRPTAEWRARKQALQLGCRFEIAR